MAEPNEELLKEPESYREESLSGTVLDERLELIEQFGRGGMGIVYKAWHRSLEKYVAVKVLHEHLSADSRRLKQMQAEARIVAELDHPNIVKIFAFGLCSSGAPYVAMELLPGKPLSTILANNDRLPMGRVVELMLQVTRALEYAHNLGVVHKDIKPGNIIVEEGANGEETAKLIDFGIARHGTVQSTTITQVVGTPTYLSPEQCIGQRGGMLSDLYAMGCVIHATATGAPPFRGETAVETMQMHVDKAPPLLRNIRADVPVSLQNIVMKLLSKNPADRYQSAALLAKDLELVQNYLARGGREPVITLSVAGGAKPRISAVGILSAISVAIFFVGLIYLLSPKPFSGDSDLEPIAEEYLHGGKDRKLVTPWSLDNSSPAAAHVSKNYSTLYDQEANKLLLAQDLKEGLKQTAPPAVSAHTNLALSRCFIDARCPEDAHKHALQALHYYKQEKMYGRMASCYMQLAAAYALVGDQKQAKSALRKVDEALSNATDSAALPSIMDGQTEVFSAIDEKKTLAPKNAESVIELHGPKDSHHSLHLAHLLTALNRSENHKATIAAYQQDVENAVELRQGCSKIVIFKELADAYSHLGLDEKSAQFLEQAINDATRISNMTASGTVQACRLNLAQLRHRQKKFSEEILLLRIGLRIWENNEWARPDNRLEMLEQLKKAYAASGTPDKFKHFEVAHDKVRTMRKKDLSEIKLKPLSD